MFVQIVKIYASTLKKATKPPKRNYLTQLLIHVITRYRIGQLSPVISALAFEHHITTLITITPLTTITPLITITPLTTINPLVTITSLITLTSLIALTPSSSPYERG